MKLARHDLVAALQLRYDHHSSQSLFDAACKRANLGDQEHYTPADVTAFRAALAAIGDRLQRVDDRLDSLLGEAAATLAPSTETAKPSSDDERNAAMPAQAPQATAPMSSPAPQAAPSTETAKPAQAPQATAPMPQAAPATESPKAAQAPQATAPMMSSAPRAAPSTETAKPAQAPQATAPMPPAPETAMSADDAPVTGETRIVLLGLEVADGETVFVCGDRAELGNWDPDRARPMLRDGDDWIAVVTSGEGVFKFLRRSEDGDVTWEGGDNRDLGAAVMIETSWQP